MAMSSTTGTVSSTPDDAARAAAGTDPVITARLLSKTFSHGGTQQHVLKNIDLDIDLGSFTVIMGPSGSGKSTLLYALSGMDRPTLGTVTVDGTEISGRSEDQLARFRRDHCGFVFQQIHLLDSLSVRDNVLTVGLLTGRPRREIIARADELFDMVGLGPRDQRKFPSMLSGGEAQRVGIVRSLITSPAVVFADEPTGQLNSEYSRVVLDLLSRVHHGGQSIVMVTHDPRTAARADRIWYLRDGSLRGHLDLPRFETESEDRLATVNDFLAEMGW